MFTINIHLTNKVQEISIDRETFNSSTWLKVKSNEGHLVIFFDESEKELLLQKFTEALS